MIFFFYGENSFLAQVKIKAIREKFSQTIDQTGHNILQLDGEEMKIDDFFKTVTATGFLASKKLITIRNIFKNKKLKNFQETLIEYLSKQKDSVDENYLIFWEDSRPSTASKLYKALKKFKFTEEFTALPPAKLSSWAKQRITQQGKEIESAALETLLSYVGNNLWQLDQEINKLVNFSQGEKILVAEVKDLIQAKANDNIFNLVDALGRKDKITALKLLEEQLESGDNAIYILTMIVRQYRILLKIKILSQKIKNNFALAQALKIHSFVAQKSLSQSKLYSLDELKNIYRKLLEMDEKLKNSTVSEKLLFSKMVNEL